MTAVTLTIFQDAEKWLRENAPDLVTDRVAAIYPTGAFNPDGLTPYHDKEEDETFECDMAAHVKALRLLAEQIGRTLFVGGLKSPFDLVDGANWDVEVTDAFFQLVTRGEVIYG